MARYRSHGPKDQGEAPHGDTQWLGVKMRVEPHLCPPGYASEAINMRFRDGVPASRLGSVMLPWCNKIVGSDIQPWGVVHGVGTFREPSSGVEYLLIAADGGVYYTRANNAPQALTLPGGESVDAECTFLHGPDVVALLRGEGQDPLVMTSILTGFVAALKVDLWDVTADPGTYRFTLSEHYFQVGELVRFSGASAPAGITFGTNYYIREVPTPDTFTVSDVAGGTATPFSTAGSGVQVTVLDGTVAMPESLHGVFAANRLFLISGDVIYASDLLDYGRHNLFNELRIQQGGADELVAIGMFGDSTMVALKRQSVSKVGGVGGFLSEMQQTGVTTRYGCVAPRSLTDVGTDLLWLSQDGVASLTLTEFGEVQAGQGALAGKPPMFSDDIEPLIKRINWTYAHNAVGAYHDRKFYLAVPLDDAELLGVELLPLGRSWGGGLRAAGPTVAGRRYRWEKGPNTDNLVNGAETLTESGEFTAQGSSVTVFAPFPSTDPVDGSVRGIYKGVNNAVLVYDFQNQAWSGHDEQPLVDIKRFQALRYLDRERLFTVSTAGWIMLYEEDFEDQLVEPYVDVNVDTVPAAGADDVQVNGGTTVPVLGVPFNNTGGATNWGCTSLSLARSNFWIDNSGNSGYSPVPSGVTPTGFEWTAPNTLPVPLGTGLRFYATNGVIPTVATTGSWATVNYVANQPITATLVTRGYSDNTGARLQGRWLSLDLETWNPALDIDLLPGGVSSALSVRSGLTKDRTKYYRPFDRIPFDTTNSNGDFLDPDREDYSVIVGGPTGAAQIEEGDGVIGNLLQEARETMSIKTQARSVQVRIVNRSGRFRLLGARIQQQQLYDHAGIKR